MDLYKEYPAHIVFLRRTFAVVAGATGHAVLERPRPFLQLSAPRLVQNQ